MNIDRLFLRRLLDPRAPLRFAYADRVVRVTYPYGGTERRLDCHLLWFIEAGSFTVRVGGRELLLGPGDAMWIDHGVAHTFLRPLGTTMSSIRFRLGGAKPRRLGRPLLHAPRAWSSQTTFAALVAELRSALPLGPERARGLLAVLCSELLRSALIPVSRGLTPGQRQRLLEWVDGHLHRSPSTADLARAVGLSPIYFARGFRRSFGSSPRRWLVDERLRRAAELLHEPGRNISEVAAAVGYRNPRLFSRQFRARYGRSPRQARAG